MPFSKAYIKQRLKSEQFTERVTLIQFYSGILYIANNAYVVF